MHDSALIIALVGLLIFAAHFFEAIFRQTRIPDVLPLVIIGLLLGPLFNIATPTHFGSVGPIFTTITFIFILFEAGIGLNLSTIRTTYKDTLLLGGVTFVLTVAAVGAAAYFLTDLGIIRSLILASAVGAIASTIIAPMLGKLKMHAAGKTVLLLESSIGDVLSVMATISLIEVTRIESISTLDIGLILGKIISSFILAAVLGVISALLWSFILNRIRNLQNTIFTTAAFVFVVFGLAEWLGYSGAVSALAFGITAGNINKSTILSIGNHTIIKPAELTKMERAFFSEMAFILRTFFFIYMGISLQLASWWIIVIGLLLTLVIYIIRLPIVKFTFKLDPSDASMLAVVIPRGLTAAVLASIPFQQEISGGQTIQNIAYAIILISIIFTSLLVFLIDRTRLSHFYSWFFSGSSKQPKA